MTQGLSGYDAWNAGLTLSAGGLAVLIMMIIPGIVVGKISGQHFFVIPGLVIVGLSVIHFASLSMEANFSVIMWPWVFQVVGLPLALIPISAPGYRGLPGNKTSGASGMLALLRNIGASISIARVVNLMHHRAALHYEQPGEHLTAAIAPSSVPLVQLNSLLYNQVRM